MTPERWQQVEAVLEKALDREGNSRAAYLEEACSGDPDLRCELDSLLAMQGVAERLMTGSVLASAAELGDDADESMVGRHVGVYEVMEKIGHGGMGEVYLAKRADDEYQKRVAIKVIKRGMDTRSILHRFRQERQILAGLDHPNIAKLLDGGTTEEGQSYLVMEYVDGLPIDVYCDTHKLSTVGRLELFLTVCSAAHYAHQNLIVHRDLKPANILITVGGGPKLLDFGIAKILSDGTGSPGTQATATVVRLMTTDYASPEQVRGQKITTATDIYSLGVLLYELLTGHRPYSMTPGGPHEMEHLICEQEPEKPSAAVCRIEAGWRTDGARQTLLTPESVSGTREGPPEKLRGKLTGDLDNIVLMALRKDTHRRYTSVEQFAEDIRRFLAQRPVIARKDTVTYRSLKFVRRNRVGVLAASLVGVSLLAGIVAASWEARRANQQRVRAEQQESDNRKLLYAAQMNLAYQAWDTANTGRALALLDAQRPKPGQEDLRGFEWSFLWRLSHADLFTLQHTGPVTAIEFSPDGRTLSVASGNHAVTSWDVGTWQKLSALDHAPGYGCMAFSKDRKTLAFVESQYHLVLWDPATNREVADFGTLSSRIMSMAFSPDGKWLAAGMQNASVVIWDLIARSTPRTFKGNTYSVSSLAFSPDGKWLASGSGGADASVLLWDLATGRRRATLSGHKAGVSSIMFSPNNMTLATGSRDATARLWDLVTNKELGKLDGLSTWVRAVVFSPSGEILATGGTDSTVKLWNVATRREFATLKGHSDYITDMTFSPDGSTLATSSWDATVKLWDVPSYRKAAALAGHDGPIHAVAFSPNGKLIATAGYDQTLRLWEAQSGREIASLNGHAGQVLSVAWSPDGETLATGHFDHTAKLWDVGTRTELASLQGHALEVRSVAFTLDGARLATGSMDGTVRLWDVKARQQSAVLNGEQNDSLNSLAISPDGRRLAVGYSSGSLTLWDLTARRRLSTRKGHAGAVNVVQFTPDGRILASGGWDRTVKFWDASALQQIDSFQGNPNELSSLAFSPDGKTLATGGGDRMVKLWDVATRQELATLKGHTELVSAVAFSPNGKTLASASYDSTVRLWQAATDDQGTDRLERSPKPFLK